MTTRQYKAPKRAPYKVGIRGIYSITCIPTGQTYIGMSTNISRRWTEHMDLLCKRTHHCAALQALWLEHHSTSFTFRILESGVPQKELREKEKDYKKNFPQQDLLIGI